MQYTVRIPALNLRRLLPLLALCCLGRPGWALTSLQFQAVDEPNGALAAVAVKAGDNVILRVRHADPNLARRWAGLVVDRLAKLADAGAGADDIKVRSTAAGFEVYGPGTTIITADKLQASASALDAQALANTWAAALRQLFAGPYLTVPWETALVPLGETFGVNVAGRPARGPFTVAVADDTVVAASPSADFTRLDLVGRRAGNTTVTLQRGGRTLTMSVVVRPRAGGVRGTVTASITGSGTSLAMVHDAIESELRANAEILPGADMKVGLPQKVARPDRAGEESGFDVPVRITGPNYIDFGSNVPVRLRNIPAPPPPADRLLVSNEPESVDQPRLLLRGRLALSKQTRLLYHHKTISARSLTYETRLLNDTDQPARVHVRDALAGPQTDEIYVGHKAMVDYWRQRLKDQGYVLLIPPRTSWTIMAVATPPQQIISGLSELTVLEGDTSGVELQMVATEAAPVPGMRAILSPTVASYTDMFLFENPLVPLAGTYRKGGLYAFLSVGRDPLRSAMSTPLLGNYGVVYDIRLGFENVELQDQRFEFVVSADGGVARAVLVVDGEVFETGLVRPTAQERIFALTLPPGGSRRYRIQVIPQSGSNYPIRLVGRPYTYGWVGKG